MVTVMYQTEQPLLVAQSTMVTSVRGSWFRNFLFTLLLCGSVLPVAAKTKRSLDDLEYRLFPRRTSEEAVVLEWGNTAIISALDGSVAHFGPQTNQAALLEVECKPILASPLNGIDQTSGETVSVLDNEDEVFGNVVVMTNGGRSGAQLSGWEQAKIAKNSGAAALLVVNVDSEHPDDVYRMPLPEGEDPDEIDIPVVMISYTSGSALTSATVTRGMRQEDVVNNGMPDRVRLYAAGDRSFFEDIDPKNPTLYLIHKMLTEAECDDLIRKAQSTLQPVEKDAENPLAFTYDTKNLHNVQRTTLWQGMLQTPGAKAIEDRIEQVTGFPPGQITDFMVDKYEKDSFWSPHYDSFPSAQVVATITIFLNEHGSPIVYPSASKPAKILPNKGLALVHHTLEDNDQFDYSTIQAVLPNPSNEPVYIARKYVLREPISIGRRVVLPLLAMPFGTPSFVVAGYDFLADKFGPEQGNDYFDKALLFFPMALVLSIIELVRNFLQPQEKQQKGTKGKQKQKKKENENDANPDTESEKGSKSTKQSKKQRQKEKTKAGKQS